MKDFDLGDPLILEAAREVDEMIPNCPIAPPRRSSEELAAYSQQLAQHQNAYAQYAGQMQALGQAQNQQAGLAQLFGLGQVQRPGPGRFN